MAGIPGWTQARLDEALRRFDPTALTSFYEHFLPLLINHARLLGVERSEREEIAATFIGDILMELPKRAAFPDDINSYVLTAFRYRVGHLAKSAIDEKSIGGGEQDGASAGSESCSAFSRSAAAADFANERDAPSSTSADASVTAFWALVRTRLSERNRVLLACLFEEMPEREIAATIGVSYDAVRVAIHRLRVRVRAVTAAELLRLEPPHRERMTRILRHANLPAHVAAEQKEKRAHG